MGFNMGFQYGGFNITHPHLPWPPLLVFCLPSSIFSLRVHVTYTEDGECPHTVWSPHSTVNTNQHQLQGEATWGQPQAVTPRAEKSEATGQMVFDCKRSLPQALPTDQSRGTSWAGIQPLLMLTWIPSRISYQQSWEAEHSLSLQGERALQVLTVHSPPLPHAG